MQVRETSPALILVALVAGVAQGQSTTETEIRSLIEAVGASGCDFERNGTSHSATEAAEHLTLKYQRGQRMRISRRNSLSVWRAKALDRSTVSNDLRRRGTAGR